MLKATSSNEMTNWVNRIKEFSSHYDNSGRITEVKATRSESNPPALEQKWVKPQVKQKQSTDVTVNRSFTDPTKIRTLVETVKVPSLEGFNDSNSPASSPVNSPRDLVNHRNNSRKNLLNMANNNTPVPNTNPQPQLNQPNSQNVNSAPKFNQSAGPPKMTNPHAHPNQPNSQNPNNPNKNPNAPPPHANPNANPNMKMNPNSQNPNKNPNAPPNAHHAHPPPNANPNANPNMKMNPNGGGPNPNKNPNAPPNGNHPPHPHANPNANHPPPHVNPNANPNMKMNPNGPNNAKGSANINPNKPPKQNHLQNSPQNSPMNSPQNSPHLGTKLRSATTTAWDSKNEQNVPKLSSSDSAFPFIKNLNANNNTSPIASPIGNPNSPRARPNQPPNQSPNQSPNQPPNQLPNQSLNQTSPVPGSPKIVNTSRKNTSPIVLPQGLNLANMANSGNAPAKFAGNPNNNPKPKMPRPPRSDEHLLSSNHDNDMIGLELSTKERDSELRPIDVQGLLMKKNNADNNWEDFWFIIRNNTLFQLPSKNVCLLSIY